MPSPALAIRTEALSRSFGPKRALESLDLTVRAGSLFALLGPNGAGKSTTIQILTTLLAPSAGRAFVDGHDVQSDPRSVRRVSGVVFQDSSLDDRLTARENLDLHGAIFGVPRRERRARAETQLAWIGLAGVGDNLVRTFSGGMKRRLEIARALVHDPSILILDEPTVGLDPQTRRAVWDKLAEIAATPERRRTVFVTTHYMDEAERCDDVVILDHGRLLARGTPKELCDRTGTTRLEDAFVSFTGHDIRDASDEQGAGMSGMKMRLRMNGRG